MKLPFPRRLAGRWLVLVGAALAPISFATAAMIDDDKPAAPTPPPPLQGADEAVDPPPPNRGVITTDVVRPPEAVSPEALELLGRIERVSEATRTLAGRIRWDRIQPLQGDEQRRFGRLVYAAGPPGRFAVQIERLVLDGELREQNRRYAFDGAWLLERLDDQRRFARRQIVPPDSDPARIDPLGRGQGPFLLPLRARKNDLLRRYHVEIVPAEDQDPVVTADESLKNTIHLRLTPRPGRGVTLTRVDIWYDAETLLPRRARTIDRSGAVSIVDVFKLKRNDKVDEDLFDTRAPDGRGWRGQIVPWRDPDATREAGDN